MNKYKGLENFCRPEFYDKIGIAQGKEEVDKSTGELVFKPGGNRWFVRHLGKSVTLKQLFTPEVFKKESLDEIDKVCQSYFKYKSLSEMEDAEKEFNDIIDSDVDEHGFSDDVSADDLFA